MKLDISTQIIGVELINIDDGETKTVTNQVYRLMPQYLIL